MKEVEVKILEVNRTSVIETLEDLGARKIFDGDIETLFFDFKNGAIIKSKDVLRLRKEEVRTELTYKKVRITSAAKVAEEYSVEVSSLETMKKILKNLGLEVIEDMSKHRISYVFERARFDIDCYLGKYDFIPEFMEIEAESIDLIRKYAGLLGFSPEKCLPWSTEDILNYYSSKGIELKQKR